MVKSIAKVGYFSITWDATAKAYTYGAVKWLESEKAGGREFSAKPRGEVSEVYADGKRVMAINENDGYDISLQLLDIIDNIEKDWLGNTVDTDNGVAEYATGQELPKFGLVLSETTVDGVGRLTWYYQCQVSKRPEKSSKTTEGKFAAQFRNFELTALPREHDTANSRLVCYEQKTNETPTTVALPVTATSEP